MGRELKRVPVDFDWPLEKIWEGYLNPHFAECPECDGSGYSRAGKVLRGAAVDLVYATEQSPREQETLGKFQAPEGVVDEELVKLVSQISGRDRGVLGFDASARWGVEEAIKELADLPEDWGFCSRCEGRGVHPEHVEDCDAWEPSEPPEGKGFQVWETVSEGSPVTPVFKTVEGLIEHLTTKGISWDRPSWSREAAESFVKDSGWSPSAIVDAEGYGPGHEKMVNN